jgi:superfamily II DNA or RNA helicase
LLNQTQSMKITVSNHTTIEGLEPKEIDAIKDFLTISNPMFHKRKGMGLFHWDIPQHFRYYELPKKGCIQIPVGATSTVLTMLKEDFDRILFPTDLTDERVEYQFENIEFLGELRDYQADMEKACLDKTLGVIQALTSAGKTVVMASLIASLRQPTLILLNTIPLANQTVNAIAKFTSLDKEDIGFIGSGKFDVKPVSVGIHQSLATYDDEKFKILNDNFSVIIADETHIIAAETFYENMSKLKAKHKYGFSGTPTREDGLTKVIHFAMGPMIHKVPESALLDYITVPTYRHVETKYDYFLPNTQDYQLMLNDMAEDEERNQLILDELKKEEDPPYSCLLWRQNFAS